MKRKEKTDIIVEVLVDSGLIEPRKAEATRAVVKQALKRVREKKYAEKKRKTLTAEEKEEIRKKVEAGEPIAFSEKPLPKEKSIDFKPYCPFRTRFCNGNRNNGQV